MRPKIAMWSDYGAPRHKHWRTPSRRSTRSSIGPKILVAAVVVVAGVIGISGIYPQIIDSEWVQGPSTHSQRVAQSEPTPTTRRSGIVAEIPLPPRRMPATTGEGVAPVPAATPTPAAPAPAVTPAPVRAATAPAPAAAPARVAAAPAPAAPAPASPPATSEMRPSVGAVAEQPAANPDAALAIADIPDAQAKADPPADPAQLLPPLRRRLPRGRSTPAGRRW